MAKYRVLQDFTTASGVDYKKASSFDNDSRRIPDEEIAKLISEKKLTEETPEAKTSDRRAPGRE